MTQAKFPMTILIALHTVHKNTWTKFSVYINKEVKYIPSKKFDGTKLNSLEVDIVCLMTIGQDS